jgi:organic radical activating enzyme
MEEKMIDHIDLVVTHKCNFKCPHCIDKFVNTSDDEIQLEEIDRFLNRLINSNKVAPGTEVLLLGGEPTSLDAEKLILIAKTIRKHNLSPIMSTNGSDREKILKILPWFDWIQITIYNKEQIDFWKKYHSKINLKLSGDKTLTMDRLKWFIHNSEDFERRSVSMYFTPDFKELCEDPEIWRFLSSPFHDWNRNGSYDYMFCNGIRFKKCIPGKTNIIDEPTVPKLYPNGNYNQTWSNEYMDDYLKLY